MGDQSNEQRSQRRNRRPDMDFTPVRNGMDYLSSAVLYLSGRASVLFDAFGLTPPPTTKVSELLAPDRPLSDRDLKYAVLHLQAAAEVLLKARLVREHWSLVFKNPGNATRAAFEQGKFDSCTMDAALDRLVSIAGVPITSDQREAIKDLAETRNALTHYGHTANAYAVEARAARVLSFLLDFVPLHLHPVLSSEAQLVEETMEAVREKLRDIEALVKNRMQELTGILSGREDRTVICPQCRQWALVIGGGDLVTCHFCLAFLEPVDAVILYWMDVLGQDESLGAVDCPDCGSEHMIMWVTTAADKTEEVGLCFRCGAVYRKTERGEAQA